MVEAWLRAKLRMGVRGVLCNKREFEIAWHKTLQGKWSDNAFTWDLIDGNGKGKHRGKYCCLNNGQERCIPDDKCNKPQQGSGSEAEPWCHVSKFQKLQ